MHKKYPMIDLMSGVNCQEISFNVRISFGVEACCFVCFIYVEVFSFISMNFLNAVD